jgi:putative transcriptional regulator
MKPRIKINMDLILVQRQMSLTELSERTGISFANLSKLKCDRARAIRFTTLLAICEVLDCKPGDLIDISYN